MLLDSSTCNNIDRNDDRETLCNAALMGPARDIQYAAEEIVELRCVMIDLDPRYLSTSLPWGDSLGDPRRLWHEHLRPGLTLIGLAEWCEARLSGTGLHLIISFSTPVSIDSNRDRQVWDARIRVLQSLLLGDPHSPGITALTRPVGSINTKNQALVETIHAGQLITAEQFAIVVDQLAAEPARTVMQYVYGTDRVTPCPYCGGDGTTCSALSRNTLSYGCCAKRDISDLFRLTHTTNATCDDLGDAQLKRLQEASRVLRDRQHGVGLEPHFLTGVIPSGQYLRDRDGAIGEVITVLTDSQRVYRYGSEVVVDEQVEDKPYLRTICTDQRLTPSASICVSRWIMCRTGDAENMRQFELPSSVLLAALTIPEYREQLPEIVHYSTRPIFASDFSVLTGGYHPTHKVLIHCAGDWDLDGCVATDGQTLRDLAPRLCEVLDTFCFATIDDMYMTVAVLVTGVLSNHFLTSPKPLIVLDGNRPGVGKTLLAQVIGVILDGRVPSIVPYSANEEEITKTIAAHVDQGNQSVVVIDNGRTSNGKPIQSTMLESMCSSANVSLRRLGHTELIERPNHYLWILSVNDPRLNADLASRSVLIQLAYDGDPGQRAFAIPDILVHVVNHRDALLFELFQLVRLWISRQCRPSNQRHRCADWARLVGGIMDSIGAGSFLRSHLARIGDVDQSRQQILELAQRVLQQTSLEQGWYVDTADTNRTATVGHLASEWILYLSSTSEAAGETRYTASTAGTKLAAMIGITCDVEVGGTEYRVILRRNELRSRRNRYYFERAVVAATPPADAEGARGGEGREQQSCPSSSHSPCITL